MPSPRTKPFLSRLFQRLAALLSPRSIAMKLYTITMMALVVIALLGGLTVVTLQRLDQSSQRVTLTFELSQRAEALFRGIVNLSQQLDDVMTSQNTDRIPAILAQNETLVSDLATYRSTAEEHHLANDTIFAIENESLILGIRRDIYTALNLYRTGDAGTAREMQTQIDRNVRHLASAIEQSATQRRVELNEETAKYAVLQQQQIWVILAIFVAGALVLFGASFGYARSIMTNLKQLMVSADALAEGNYTHRIETRAGDEVARLATAFNHMAASVQDRQERVIQQQQTIEQRAAELEHTLATLRQTIDERDQLTAAIREVSSPVLPIADNLLAMPLIGVIDTERAAFLTRSLLAAIERHKATIAIIDVTGVPIIDTQVARALLDAARAARLLGTSTVLVGLRPELAQTIVGLGISLTDVVTQADLQSGIRYALQHHKYSHLAQAL